MIFVVLNDGRRMSWDDMLDEAERTQRVYAGKMYRKAFRYLDEEPWEVEYDKFESKFVYSDEDGLEVR